MNYRESLQYLNQKGNEVQMMHLGLHRTLAMMEELGQPHTQYPTVHIAGTNGKGSVAAMTEAILREAGLVTGMYTSPHLVRVEERLRVGGVPATAREFARLATRIRAAEETLVGRGTLDRQLTTFEFITCCAFLHFAHKKIDIAVMEVGLGGKLDATNIIQPLVSVITGVALDHQQYLGHTISEIAAEKAGIIKKGVPAISGCTDAAAAEVMRRQAAAVGAPLLEVGVDFIVENVRMHNGRATMDLLTSRRNYRDLRLALAGAYQTGNAALAVRAIEEIAASGTFTIERAAISRGLAGVRWDGRLDEYAAARRTLLDGAHNPDAARLLADYLREECREKEIYMVFGAVRDKNIAEVGAALFPLVRQIYLTPLRNSRTATAEDIAALFPERRAIMTLCPDMRAALRRAWTECPLSGLVVITGSLYLVGELLPVVRKNAGSHY